MFIFFMKWEELCSPARATFETRATFKNPNFQSLVYWVKRGNTGA